MKKKKRNISITNEELEKIPNIEDINDIIVENEEKQNLYYQIEQLDEKTKQIILLRIVGDMTFREIGEVFNKTDAWARVNFYRAKQKLKEVVKNEQQTKL